MYKLNLWKMLSAAFVASLAGLLFMSSAGAISGTDIKLRSSDGGAEPDIEVSSDGTYLAVAYYKQDSATPGKGAVYLKSASLSHGWVSSTFLGKGSSPRVAFKKSGSDSSTTVYVVWVDSNATAIQSARCTLNLTTQPSCSIGDNVRMIGAGNLAAPDLTVDDSNFLHVAWVNSNAIETTRSTAADNLSAWLGQVTPGLCAGSKAEEPVLGWTSTSNLLHLAFLCGDTSQHPATSIEYRRSANNHIDNHNWIDELQSFAMSGYGATPADEVINSDHSRLNNLALAAGGAQVSLVWDGRVGTSSDFRLMSITSTDQGSSWPVDISTKIIARYVPSGNDAFASFDSENKLSTFSPVPPQEFGLRPSLVISGTVGNAAVVWQQKPGASCGFGTSNSSDIYFVSSQFAPGTPETLEHGTVPTDYSIDPDLAVTTGGTQHFIFMKDDHASDDCVGGDKADYAIYYRGPIIDQTYDQGEIGNGNIYLPIIVK